MSYLTCEHSTALKEVAAERARQDAKWGEQNHPDGTSEEWKTVAVGMTVKADSKAAQGKLTWRDILEEEIWEAYAETDPARLRAELIQIAAVAVNWVEAIDRRKAAEARS